MRDADARIRGGMIIRSEAERLAQAMHCLRPDWPVQQLMALVAELQAWPLLDLTVGLAYVAQEQTLDGRLVSKSPYRVKEQGPWRTVGTVNADVERQRQAESVAVASRHSAIATRRQAIEACELCDDRGYVGARVCLHDQSYAVIAARGAAAARAAIRPGPNETGEPL